MFLCRETRSEEREETKKLIHTSGSQVSQVPPNLFSLESVSYVLSVTLACADYSVVDGIQMVRFFIYSMVRYITTTASASRSCLCVDFSST